MTLSRREVFMLSFLMVLIVGGGYFTMFLMPINDEISTLRMDLMGRQSEIGDASNRTIQYQFLSNRLNELQQEWEEVMDGVPMYFDDADILRRLQRLVYHYVSNLSITITTSPPRQQGEMGVNGVQLRFSSDIMGLEALLHDIWLDYSETRIIEYSITAVGGDGQDGQLNVIMYLEFLTIEGRY